MLYSVFYNACLNAPFLCFDLLSLDFLVLFDIEFRQNILSYFRQNVNQLFHRRTK